MIERAVLYLIMENPKAHGVFGEKERTERMVYATVGSVGRREYYEAHNQGFMPEIVVTLSRWQEYHGENKAKLHDTVYDVIRSYRLKTGGIELTLQRSELP